MNSRSFLSYAFSESQNKTKIMIWGLKNFCFFFFLPILTGKVRLDLSRRWVDRPMARGGGHGRG